MSTSVGTGTGAALDESARGSRGPVVSPGGDGERDEELRVVRAELSRIIEPGDLLAGVLLARLGPRRTHALISGGAEPDAQLTTCLAAGAEEVGIGRRGRRLQDGLARWRARLGQCDGARELATMRRFGGGLLIPEDPGWPVELEALGAAAPVALWHRGGTGGPDSPSRDVEQPELSEQPVLPWIPRTAAVVGSREITDYGLRATAEMVEDLVGHGVCVISGGAYGVDAAAHRAALRVAERRGLGGPGAAPPTVAVLAGGLDRWYPAGNERLLQGVADHGLVLSELPPGAAPTKHRFLQRNRLIAALSAATVIVEARWRSGAQSTAHHALSLGRPVGAVPGSIFSATSAGCHRLLRETPTTAVTDAADVVELMAGDALSAGSPPGGRSTQAMLPVIPGGEREGPGAGAGPRTPPPRTDRSAPVRPQDGMSQEEVLLHDALPKRGSSTPGKLAAVAGLAMPQVYAALTRLERAGHARRVEGRWGRSTPSP
ncbi:DNA-processing protein DprA [Nesterenkonia sp. F]|uniref:DNA-processing protein DprA n=1 Tax=Nesterenkonia sp. F TaxID=795955 RepID=UPI000255D547|nr:DNA-processing protein DprA [Nesterenkonia sp. F]